MWHLLQGIVACLVFAPFAAAALGSYVNFETVPVRPLALSPDGSRLFAVNTPGGRLEIFDVDLHGLRHRASVAVGVDPVAVAARTADEVWVVNHLSDSVSILDVGADPPRVVRTLLVGDEPWDIVFAGPRAAKRGPFTRAFVSAARRGQHHPGNANAEQKTPGLGRADVWVFDTADLGSGVGGSPETIVQVFGDKPRALAASPDGARVYVGVFHSGNRTASVNGGGVCDGGMERGPCIVTTAGDPTAAPAEGEVGTGSPPVLPGGLAPPTTDAFGNPAPETGLIVRFDEAYQEWRDSLGRNWNGAVPFSLPDLDVFAIDALAEAPVEVGAWAEVGTILFQMAVHPKGRIFVANTEAINDVRFEGPGVGEPTVRGHLHEARVSVLSARGDVITRHLNKHIEYGVSPVPADTAARSLAQPAGLAFSESGRTLFVAAFGSAKVGIFDTADLASDRFTPTARDHIELSGGGPAGLVADPRRPRLYVYTRFDNAISVVDLKTRREMDKVALYNPEPVEVREGRSLLYDARHSSSNGETSCGSCHIFGDKDDLAWNLGDPTGVQVGNPNPFQFPPVIDQIFHPLKGPMITQTLRGMQHSGPMHWRGDRSGAMDPANGDAFDPIAGFEAFNPAFVGLLGRDEGMLDANEMRAFAEFALTILLPPNPLRELDDRDTPGQAEGRRSFVEDVHSGQGRCNGCHRLDPELGFFGTNGNTVFDGGPQHLKIPHLRNVYDKVGSFGFNILNPPGNDGFELGEQVRGFGLTADGSAGSVASFLSFGFTFATPQQKSDVEDFVLAFPTDLAPAVGQQVTRPAGGSGAADGRVDLLLREAARPFVLRGVPMARACDLVVKGVVGGEARGWVFDPGVGAFRADRAGEPATTAAALASQADASQAALTYTCHPPGSGRRAGIDADADGVLDRDELDAGTDPVDAASVAGACSDGIDNDADGVTDFPQDPGCEGSAGHSEGDGLRVAIDVTPGDPGNRVVLGLPAVRVAVLASARFGPGDVDAAGLRFGPRAAPPVRAAGRTFTRRRDVNGDGMPDLVVGFSTQRTGLGLRDQQGCLSGRIAGERFIACDAVRVRGFAGSRRGPAP